MSNIGWFQQKKKRERGGEGREHVNVWEAAGERCQWSALSAQRGNGGERGEKRK